MHGTLTKTLRIGISIYTNMNNVRIIICDTINVILTLISCAEVMLQYCNEGY